MSWSNEGVYKACNILIFNTLMPDLMAVKSKPALAMLRRALSNPDWLNYPSILRQALDERVSLV